MKKVSNWMWMIALAALFAAGCGPENGSNQNNDSNNAADAGDVENNDAGDTSDAGDTDMSDVGDTDDDGDGETCEPITECGADQCGSVDDGCGGTLECATACRCQGGEAQEDTCGSCGLGVLECGADEDGFGTCVTPPIPDDLACEDVLYVDTDLASDGDGSANSPLATYVSAFAAASTGQTIIIGGDVPIESMIEVKDGVSVIGGYNVDGDMWTFDPEKKQEVATPAASAGDTFGVAAIDLQEDTMVYGLDITTADAADGASHNNYGAYVVGTDTLTLEFVDVFAGRGGSGADGALGARGADGTVGADAEGSLDKIQQNGDNPGAPAGINTDCPVADGGAGGHGGEAGFGGTIPGQDGEDASGASGGDGGLYATNRRAGGDGDDALEFSQAAESGEPAMAGGSVSDERVWVAAGTGEDGARGAHGSGGGGGGGAAGRIEDPNAQYPDHDEGPGGAGGGAGGCGGHGGDGGQPGGGSFGLFAVESDITLNRVRFNASAGGLGGEGGPGGAGGSAGDGGQGTSDHYEGLTRSADTLEPLPWRSGHGGDGADGQRGGDGAGGAGGVSYGAYCKQSRLDQTDVEFSEGAVAAGGTSPGADGREGLAVEMEGCQ